MAAQATSVFEAYRAPVEAMDDIDWFCQEASSEMGEGSSFGAMLERASQERELEIFDDEYMHGKRPGYYGKSLSAGPWEEFVADASIRRTKHSPPRVLEGGYKREIWGAPMKQTACSRLVEPDVPQLIAAEMFRNVGEMLFLVPQRLRTILITHHQPRRVPMVMRHVFGTTVRIAHLARIARSAYEAAAETRASSETTVAVWLEGVAIRFREGKGRSGEKGIVEGTRRENRRELAAAYAACEEARARLPRRRYPHQSEKRRAQHLSLVGM